MCELQRATSRPGTPRRGHQPQQPGAALPNPGKYAKAEPLYQRALAIWEKALGPEHPDVATSLNNLAELYDTQGQYAQGRAAVPAGAGDPGKGAGPGAPRRGHQPQQPGAALPSPGQYAKAEPLYQRALAIWEKALGPEHPDVATSLNNLAALYDSPRPIRGGRAAVPAGAGDPGEGAGPGAPRRGRQPQQPGGALPQPRPIREGRAALPAGAGDLGKGPGPGAPRRGHQPQQPGVLYDDQGQYAKAEPLYQRALAIREKALGPEHPDVATEPQQPGGALPTTKANTRRPSRCTSGRWRSGKRRWARSTPTWPPASTTWRCSTTTKANTRRPSPFTSGRWRSGKRPWARSTPTWRTCLENYALLLRNMDRSEEAEPLESRARAIRAKTRLIKNPGGEGPPTARPSSGISRFFRHVDRGVDRDTDVRLT